MIWSVNLKVSDYFSLCLLWRRHIHLISLRLYTWLHEIWNIMVSIHIQLKSFLLREKVIAVREKKRKSDLLLLLDTGITRLLRATKSPVLREQLMGPSQVFPDWSLFTIQSSISPCLMVSPVPVVWNSLMSFPIISSRPKPRTFSAVWLHQTICNYEIGEPLPPSLPLSSNLMFVVSDLDYVGAVLQGGEQAVSSSQSETETIQ